MKKVSTAARKQSRNISQRPLTIGLGVGRIERSFLHIALMLQRV